MTPLLQAFFSSFFLFFEVALAAARAAKPHIITIIADDHGWANVGFHREPGFKETVTPTIDGLVKQGIELDRHYAYRFCSPSRSSFQSGRLPVHVNVENAEPTSYNPDDLVGGYAGIPVNMTGVAQKMKEGGYRTHMTGKWDCGMATQRHTPQGRGYDSFFGYFHHANDYWTEHLGRTSTGVVDICNNEFVDLWDTDKPARGVNGTAYEEELFERATLQVINDHDAAVPLFLVHAFHIVHTPLQVPLEYSANFSFILEPGRRTYHAMVHYMDNVLGRIVDALKAKDMWENTLMLYFSDNGGPLYVLANANNYPLRGGKFSDWEGGVRVNAFVSGGFVPPSVRGTKYEGLISIADWYATFASIGGIDVRDGEAVKAGLAEVDGVNVWPHLTGGAPHAASARSELHLSTQALIQGQHKLIVGMQSMNLWPGEFYPTFRDALHPPLVPGQGSKWTRYTLDCKEGCLYNVFDDPSERRDLALEEGDVLARMQERLRQLNKGFYNPERGQESPLACAAAREKYGGFYGPFLDVQQPDSPATDRSAETLLTV